MIKRKIVFVLGAGASIPLGYPSGEDLKTQLVQRLSNGDPLWSTVRAIPTLHDAELQELRNALQFSGAQSVDALLEHRGDLQLVGKASIAALLLEYEDKSKLFAPGTWLGYVFNKMRSPFQEFSKNAIAFVTFNYDLSIEEYLHTALTNSYQARPEEIMEQYQGIRIIHLHGQLGELDWMRKELRRYGEGKNSTRVCFETAKSIKVISEAHPASKEFEEARSLITSASEVVFIGFGYQPDNMGRLMPALSQTTATLRGSSMGLGFQERESAVKIIGQKRLRIDALGLEALDYLKENIKLD